MSERNFEDKFMAELAKQMLEEAKKGFELEDYKSDKDEDYRGLDSFASNLTKLALDGAYESAWVSDEGFLKERLETASKRLYNGKANEDFPYMELFIIGLYGMVSRIRSDLNECEFTDIVGKNSDLINDLY